MKHIISTKTGKILMSALLLLTISFSAKGQIAKDKQLHLGAGAVVAGWGYLLPSAAAGWKPMVYGLGSATLAGAGKELADMGGFGNPDWKDLGATIVGGAVSVGIILGVKAIFKKQHNRNNKQRRFVYVP
jgi:hypothetical protein